MSILTSVQRDGQWVTETVDMQTVLNKAQEPKPVKQSNRIRPPTCGLLTRTVVETELAHFILPVRLRSSHNNDVAFVGDHYVQIRELRPDGQLQDVLRKKDFGSRIRNAAVLGSITDIKKDEKDETSPGSRIKSEDDDVIMDESDGSSGEATAPRPAALPPQMLALVLESGDTVFLYISSGPDGTLEFKHTRFGNPKEQLRYGFHMDIDPSSRYLALGSAEKGFVVFQLNSLQSLEEQSRLGQPLTPVVSYRMRSVQGVLHQMKFLYPRPGDDHHVILLLIVVRNGMSRMATYEWELGDNLKDVFAEEKRGHRMPVENQMPLLIIPLTVRSAFIAISEEQIAVCTETLHGPPHFETFNIDDDEPTSNYHGRDKPLWTAWARPYRLSEWFRANDGIYLAREDGVVYFIEADSDSTLSGSVPIAKLDCSIATAFCCIYEIDIDVLVAGGDSGPGGIWKVAARQEPVHLGALPNWSPVVDFTTTDEFSTWNQEVGAAGTRMVPWQDKKPSKPDRVFSTSGRGTKGTVTEYRYGLQAQIGLIYECGLGVKQAFVLPASLSSKEPGYDLVLSLPDQTTVLRISEDFREISQPPGVDDGTLKYDLSSRTLMAVVTQGIIIQVTEQNIVLINGAQASRLSPDKLGGTEPVTILDAVVCDEYIAISTHSNMHFRLHVLRIADAAGLHLEIVKSYDLDAEVTCLSLCRVQGTVVEVLAGLWKQEKPFLGRARVGGVENPGVAVGVLEVIDVCGVQEHGPESAPNSMEALHSIASCVHDGEQYTVMGFRSGETMTVRTDKHGVMQPPQVERLGGTVAGVLLASDRGAKPMVLVSSDAELTLVTDLESHNTNGARLSGTKHRVWPVDMNRPMATSPAVHSFTVLPDHLISDRDGTVALLLVSGPNILLTELQLKPGPAHRHIPVNGTPTRILYSHHLKCLVVAIRRKTQPTLMFLDPDTGEDIGTPVDKQGNIYEFARGLGKPGDKVLALAEWEYKKDNNVWHFLVIGMAYNRLMILSAERERHATPDGRPPRVRYFSRFQRKNLAQSVYSVLGHEDVLIYCVGKTIQWEGIDTAEKRLRPLDSYELNSPATSLSVINGRLVVLTARDSVEVVERNAGQGRAPELLHSDPRHRRTQDMIEVAGGSTNDPAASVVLVCDQDCGVDGLWVPWQSAGKNCEVVVEAELGASIRKFCRGRTRPVWEGNARGVEYGRIAMTMDDAEVLGVCLDGSLVSFQLLNWEVWRVLRFILNLALADDGISPFSGLGRGDMADWDPDIGRSVVRPEMMHIDGDTLERLVRTRALERLMALPVDMSRLKELLDDLEDGRLTDVIAGKTGEEEVKGLFAVAYRILQHFLAPVL